MNEQNGNRTPIRLRDPRVLSELLGGVRAQVDGIQGAVVTSRDGMVLSADTGLSAADGDAVASQAAAMAAAAAGIGSRFLQVTSLGRMQGAMFEGDRGCIGIVPLSSTLLLVLLGTPNTTLGRFTVAAKRAVAILLAPDQG
ncbi:roadblock/LC7 domain-containing protein [Umezawaea beigongshangensis]|uniref:roadblock/LC7 domain-containing protein n=1 Tax=Umezawaea beigongshangensis TaxID=2780383 RepID=UPI0018F11787|nr:roadblock/LC7 domain-containing protein [Umezawaea beigongshangensis]